MLETMPISEKLKMLRGRRELTLDELAEQTGLSRSALSNYETNESKEVSQFALVTLAKFYGVSTDYLLGLSALENPMQVDIHDLNISSEMAELLKSGKINNRLLCEMATHPDFPKLLMDMEIMVDGEARNAIRAIDMLFEAVRMKIIKVTNISEDSNAQILTFKEAQIDEDEYFEMKIKNDLRPILRFLRDKYAERSEGSRQLEEIEKYVQQWRKHFFDVYTSDTWSKLDPRLSNTRFSTLTSEWTWNTPLRTDYERRQALVEIDVLTAMALGMTLEQLKTIYRIQFPVLQSYEADTWYDANGRITFTNNRSLVGVGFDRKEFELNMKDAPAGKKFYRTIMDDTMPGGPVERTIEYVAPFDRCDRERDYETAWKFFEEKYKEV